MPDPATATALKELGLAGYVISGMASTILALASANVIQWRLASKAAAKFTTDRLAERDILTAALNNASKAIEAISRASEERNEVTEELAVAIQNWTASMEVIKERMSLQHDANSEKLNDIKFVTSSFADSVRTLTGIVTEVRNWTLQQQPRRTR